MLKLVETAPEMEAEMLPTLDELAREGARQMLVTALEEEVAACIEAHRGSRDEHGHALVVRNGKARPRNVTMGAGTVEVAAPCVNDKRPEQRFTSRILPPFTRPSTPKRWSRYSATRSNC